MDLYEYQGKQYFARFGIPTSPGGFADTVDEAVEQAERAGYPVVVKAQVKVGGRGKAGGIIPEADIPALKEMGVAEVFTPGAPLDTTVGWLADTLDRREEAAAGS